MLWSCELEEETAEPEIYTTNETSMAARTEGRYFQIYSQDGWETKMVHGVNIGTALPGKWFTEFPSDRGLYRSWLEKIAEMNINTIRLYTLLDPTFYQVFSEFNRDPSTPRIWLIQEIWPHDEVPDLNFHNSEYKKEYQEEITKAIDALHGNAEIPSRPYRAYGTYSADVSPYILGILIGRELEPHEVEATNEANPQLNEHPGDYVQIEDATPTEVWLAEMSDFAAAYAHEKYQWQYPVGMVSWPTLDPLTHPTEYDEDGKPSYNEREEVDPAKFETGPEKTAGFFGAYHIYPNYPDFMNNEPRFAEYSDRYGTFRYRGYLHEFMEIHPPYPALVAEFGISTSHNTAHLNPDGLHHGGLSEIDQGKMVGRMMESIWAEGYAGSIIFEWADEWAKKTWNTEPYMVPWDRQNLWKNAMDPEQNYGLLSYEPQHQPFSGSEEKLWEASSDSVNANTSPSGKSLKSLELDADEAFLYLSIKFNSEEKKEAIANNENFWWEKHGLVVGIDTGNRDKGEFKLPLNELPQLPTGAEFLLHLSEPEQGDLLVTPSYNRAEYEFSPEASRDGSFERIEPLVNRERVTKEGTVFPALYADESELNYGYFPPAKEEYDSLSHWYYKPEEKTIKVRLPWMLLNVSDPSSAQIINDDGEFNEAPARDELEIETTDGFLFYAALYDKEGINTENNVLSQSPPVLDFQPRDQEEFSKDKNPYLWELWEEPAYRSRLKESHQIIKEYGNLLPDL